MNLSTKALQFFDLQLLTSKLYNKSKVERRSTSQVHFDYEVDLVIKRGEDVDSILDLCLMSCVL